MSGNIGSHTFRNTVTGSVIQVDVGLHDNIDYGFFDSGDTIAKFDEHKNCEADEDDKETEEQVKQSDLKVASCGDSKLTSISKVMKIKSSVNEEKNCKEKKETVVRFSSIEPSSDKSEETIKTNYKKDVSNLKEERSVKLKELMNCIAYGESKGNEDDDEDDNDVISNKLQSFSPDFLSLSTDTTSEITDVTTRPSSSGCSSMSKHEYAGQHLSDSKTSKFQKNAQRKQKNQDKQGGSSGMKLLLDALDDFDRHERKSVTSSILSTERRNRLGRKNMSFSNEQCWIIQRENSILLKKLEDLRKPRPKPPPSVTQPRLSSSALNRRKQQAKIDHDNMVLLKKIEQAKPSSRIAMSSIRR